MVEKTKFYMQKYGEELVKWLTDGEEGKIIVVNCQMGLHRSLEFATVLGSLVNFQLNHG